jgi:spermidine/putrescine transport system permease protein
MTEMTTSAAPVPVQRGERIKFSWWDHLMKFSDIGIVAWAFLMYAFLYIPIVVLIIYSFNSQRLNVTWEGFTLEWYYMKPSAKGVGVIRDTEVIELLSPWSFLAVFVVSVVLIVAGSQVLSHVEKRQIRWIGTALVLLGSAGIVYEMFVGAKGAFPTSIQIAVLSTAISVVIGTLASFALVRFEFRTKTVWDGLNYTKIIIAEIVAGVSTLLFFVQLVRWLDQYFGFSFWGLFNLGFSTVLIAHVAWNIPFVVVIIRARLQGFDKALEEAGSDLGSTPVGVFFRITLPVIAPGILAASLLAFTLSFDDFITTFFTSGPQMTTLPLLIWSKVRMGITPEINAISTFMVAFSMIIVAVLEVKAHISEDII